MSDKNNNTDQKRIGAPLDESQGYVTESLTLDRSK